ncbi:MAG: hypothetical protein LAN63_19730 [Acidobacteriia bacterium]|nr:hypothetical protein [Terriglobia bacterium]
MLREKPETLTMRRFLYAVSTALFLLSWGYLLSYLVHDWHACSVDRRVQMVAFSAVYPIPWLRMIVERPKSLALAVTTYVVLSLAVPLARLQR